MGEVVGFLKDLKGISLNVEKEFFDRESIPPYPRNMRGMRKKKRGGVMGGF